MSLLSPSLEAFVAIVQEKTVHGAAKKLYLTQTAVTQRIRSLETKLRTTLFIRTRRGMNMTPEGEELLRYCQGALELEGRALSNIDGTARSVTINMSMTGPTSIMHSRIMPKLFTVMRQFPFLLVKFVIDDMGDGRVKGLRSGEFQFAILQQEDLFPEISCKALEPEKYVLVCSSKWKSRKLRNIIQNERIIDFDSSDHMTFNYLKQHKLFQYSQHQRHFVNRTNAVAAMIVEGFGYGVLTQEFAHDYVKGKQLMVLNEGKTYENNIALAWYHRPELPNYFKKIIDAID